MKASWLRRGLKLAAAFGVAAALSGCIIAPYAPGRYGYYHPHPYGYY